MPSAQEYAVPAAWGQSPYTDLDLPSGGKVQVKRIDLETIVAADLIDEFDKLSPTVEEKVVGPAKGKNPQDRQGKKPTKKQAAVAEEKANQDAMRAFFSGDNVRALVSLMNRVLPQIVVQPKVQGTQVKDDKSGEWVPMDPADRVDGVIYVDTIPLGDQMAILAFGMEGLDMDGLQSFREQSESPVADVEAEPKYQDPPI